MANSLRARWNDDAAAQTVADSLKKGSKRVSSPFGHVDGRADIRGLDVGTACRHVVSGVRMEHVDFSGSIFAGALIERSLFRDVKFDLCDMRGVRDAKANTFEQCNFRGTDFSESGIGLGGSSYVGCRFEGASFTAAVFIRAEFDDCRFDRCRLDGVDFNASSFVRCTFVGELSDVWFRGGYGFPHERKRYGRARSNTMSGVDFSEATLRMTTFSQACDLSTVAPPADRHVMVVDLADTLRRVRQAAEEGMVTAATADHFIGVHDVYRLTGQTCWILNSDDIELEYGPDAASLWSVLNVR